MSIYLVVKQIKLIICRRKKFAKSTISQESIYYRYMYIDDDVIKNGFELFSTT